MRNMAYGFSTEEICGMDIINKNKPLLLLIITGFAAGTANGMLGAGGGIIIVYGLSAALGPSLSDKRDIYANALCVMLPVSVVSCVLYALRGSMNVPEFGKYVIPAVLGGIAGGFLLGRIPSGTMKKIFAALVIVSGVLLMIR